MPMKAKHITPSAAGHVDERAARERPAWPPCPCHRAHAAARATSTTVTHAAHAADVVDPLADAAGPGCWPTVMNASQPKATAPTNHLSSTRPAQRSPPAKATTPAR